MSSASSICYLQSMISKLSRMIIFCDLNLYKSEKLDTVTLPQENINQCFLLSWTEIKLGGLTTTSTTEKIKWLQTVLRKAIRELYFYLQYYRELLCRCRMNRTQGFYFVVQFCWVYSFTIFNILQKIRSWLSILGVNTKQNDSSCP